MNNELIIYYGGMVQNKRHGEVLVKVYLRRESEKGRLWPSWAFQIESSKVKLCDSRPTTIFFQ